MTANCLAGEMAVEAVVWVRRVCATPRDAGWEFALATNKQKREKKRTSSAMVMVCIKESGRVLEKRRQRDVTMPKGRLQKKGRKLRGMWFIRG